MLQQPDGQVMPISQVTGPGGRLLAVAALTAALSASASGQPLTPDGPRSDGQEAGQRYRKVRPPPGPARGLIDAPAWLVWAVGAGIFAGSLAIAVRVGRADRP